MHFGFVRLDGAAYFIETGVSLYGILIEILNNFHQDTQLNFSKFFVNKSQNDKEFVIKIRFHNFETAYVYGTQVSVRTFRSLCTYT